MSSIFFGISQVLGLVPFNRLNIDADTAYDYGAMFVIPLIYILSYCLANFNTYSIYKLEYCDCICRLGNSLFIHLGVLVYSINYIINLLRRKHFYFQFKNLLVDIDNVLEKISKNLHVDVPAHTLLAKYFRKFSWIIVAGLLSYAVLYDVLWTLEQYGSLFFIASMATTFPYVASSIVQGQFAIFVSEISDRFTKLNGFLTKICLECDKQISIVKVYDIENDWKIQLKNTSLNKTMKEKEAMNKNKKIALEENLSDLFCLHEKILSLSVITNREYALQIVPYMSVCFIISIFGIFLETKVISIVGGRSPQLDYVAHIYVIWSLTTITVAYLLLRICYNANGHSKISATIVHEIMQKKPTFMLSDDLYYNKMKSFTLQYLHWEGYFQFNGVGLFTLDYTFIFSAVSAATSYLIVLLQFDMTAILKGEGLME